MLHHELCKMSKSLNQLVELQLKNSKPEVVNLAAVFNYVDKQVVLQKMGICQRTLQNYRKLGKIRYYRHAGKLYYDLQDVISNMKKAI